MNLFIQSGMDIYVTRVVQGHVPQPPGDGWNVVGVLAAPDVDTGIAMSQLSFIWTRSHIHAEHEGSASGAKEGDGKIGGKKLGGRRANEPDPYLYPDPVVRERNPDALKKVYEFACPTCGAKIGELCRDKPRVENPEMGIRSNGYIHTKRLGAMNDAAKAAGKVSENA
jgi:hypothetical protein